MRYLAPILLGFVAACSQVEAERPRPEGSPVASDALTRRGDFESYLLLTGALEAVRSTQLTAPNVPTGELQIRWMEEDGAFVRAGQKVLKLGPKFVVIKKGEHGAMFFSEHETYVMPAYPTPQVIDPTGAGDSFAGGMMGYLAAKDNFDPRTLKEAMAYGILTASFTVEDFSLDRLKKIGRDDVEKRMEEYRRMLSF